MNLKYSHIAEEDFPAAEASKEYLKEASSADVPPKEENHLEPAAEGKVFQEKVGCLIPDDTEVVEDLCFNTENSSKKGKTLSVMISYYYCLSKQLLFLT